MKKNLKQCGQAENANPGMERAAGRQTTGGKNVGVYERIPVSCVPEQ